MWCFLSCKGDLRESLILPQEVRPSFKLQGAAWDSSGVTAGNRASSRFEAGNLGFFYRYNRGVRPPFML